MIEKYNSMTRINLPWFRVEYYPFYFTELKYAIKYKRSPEVLLKPKYSHGVSDSGRNVYGINLWCLFIGWDRARL